ncbi:MAG: LexA family transcriptional regulator [Bacteroidota bacterium]
MHTDLTDTKDQLQVILVQNLASIMASRIREARGNLSRSDLGKRINRSEKTIQRWEVGDTSPTVDDLGALAIATNKSVSWLLGLPGSVDIAPLDAPDQNQPVPPPGGKQLHIVEIDAAAGAGSVSGLVVNERPVATYVIDQAELEEMLDGGPMPKDPFVWRMIGESNEPEFRDGERLIVEPYPTGETRIKGSGFYLFRLEDLIEVKQLERMPGRILRISSRNPQYAPYEIKLGEGVDFAILGRVRGRWKRY